MRTITLDYFRRWGWVFILAAVLQLAFNLIAPAGQFWISMLLTAQCGALLLSFDLARGTARVHRSLPVSRGDLARSWQLVAIVAPFLVFACSLLGSNAVKAVFGFGIALAPMQAAFWMALALIWLGMCFHLLTHTPRPESQDQAKSGLAGILWGISFGGGILFSMKMPARWQELQPWHWGVLAAAACSALLGWRRSETMADRRAGAARAGDATPNRARQEENGARRNRRGGLPFLFRSVIGKTLRATGMMILLFTGSQIVLHKTPRENWLEAAERIVRDPTTSYILLPMALLVGMQWMTGIPDPRLIF